MVYLKDGGMVEGKVQQLADKIVVDFQTGSVSINKSDIERIESRALPQQIFNEKLMHIGDDADACVKVAQWALAKNMPQEYVLGLRRALQIDRKHAEARRLLRDYQHRMAYLPENETAARKMLVDMGPDFHILRSHHYRICYNSSDIFAEITAELLEDVYDQFVHFFTDRNFDPAPITDRLEVVLFDARHQYIDYTARIKREYVNSAGFYDYTSRRCFFYDALNTGQFLQERTKAIQAIEENKKLRRKVLQNRDARTYYWTNPQGQRESLRRSEVLAQLDQSDEEINQFLEDLRNQYRDSNITTPVHEAVHQLAYQCGIHSRTHENPLWLVEGLATYFEAAHKGRWYGPGDIHTKRLDLFLVNDESDDYVGIAELISSDKLLKLDQSRASAGYAAAWSLFYYLSHQYHEALFDYIYDLSVRSSREPYNKTQRIKDFNQYFGRLSDLEYQWRQYMAPLSH